MLEEIRTEHDAAHAPNISLRVVAAVAFDDFWSHPEDSAFECGVLVDIGRVGGLGNSKIGYLAFPGRLDEDVLGFEVAMDNAARVKVFEASEDLLAE